MQGRARKATTRAVLREKDPSIAVAEDGEDSVLERARPTLDRSSDCFMVGLAHVLVSFNSTVVRPGIALLAGGASF